MKYLTIQEIKFAGASSALDEHASWLMDALLDLEDADASIEDPDLATDLPAGRLDIQMVAEADDPAEAMTRALCAVRAAIHAIGGKTPGWEIQGAVMHAAPVDASDRLLAIV